jgi:hypothetical protein
MGLDQHFYSTNEDITLSNSIKNKKRIHDYRNHWQLQCYMEQIYRKRGGKGDFSCINLECNKEECLELLEAIQTFSLPRHSPHYDIYFTEEEYKKMSNEVCKMKRSNERHMYFEDIKSIKECLKEIEEGKKVYYWSWW